ncbi:YgaP family membrane protein [Carboxylicivirga marina]|uniref:DUF2892 domain-containing protein n=1 Tax=Carboxylicivirga marina TaxID=2800988 RepID=A0ABS1HRV7_9BACT|nr:DUF2892 domain-containing protein [Carboxylicivirga marina]MBK3519919.1 DUF2892 domain-containing protein [Carboxylicivirga marina]
MKRNVGSMDKMTRIIIGLTIGIAGYYYNSWWGLIGIIPVFTALINWCPLYLPFGIKTCKK